MNYIYIYTQKKTLQKGCLSVYLSIYACQTQKPFLCPPNLVLFGDELMIQHVPLHVI